ncbi:unnamed protein product [Adineta steineri]|uniref:NHL repeat containing protein n=1 Tax=Adineta steineri TaxID=433720 RepID=A0A814LD77_9BILA|nr:unnamed protein product [Adineta steineri]CAF3808404.1 unnamed protein product [Adineta steineri]
MTTINIYCYVVFIILRKTPQYGPCSTNSACGCFHMVGTNDDAGVCGFLWPTCYRLVPCNSSSKPCQSNTICVRHPECDDRPLCYPIEMIDQTMCPPMQGEWMIDATSLSTLLRYLQLYILCVLDMINSQWKQHGITVAGGNGLGNGLNQLFYPLGISVDDKKTIYTADPGNHRIIEWKYDSKNGQVIAGGNGQGNRNDQLNAPEDVIFDKNNNSLIICDRRNKRVVRWFHQNQIKQQILISGISCGGLAMDKNGFLYVCDGENNGVRQWKEGDGNGRIVAGGNGYGNNLNQISTPYFVFVDEDSSLYVSDYEFNRVMKWKKGAKEGSIVAGGNGTGNGLNQLVNPIGVIVDQLGQIYVADAANGRVVRWREGNDKGEIVVGGNGIGRGSNQLNRPTGLSFDIEGNLYVVDSANHRVQKFLIDI